MCSTGDGDRLAALLYPVLVTLTAVIVPLAILFNLAVVLTVLLNRKLHTIINVLVTVLGINNLAWTGLPILMTIQVKLLVPAMCTLRASLFVITRGVTFAVIVAITVLRYLMVVRNHSYPANKQNVMLFVSIAVVPGLVKWIIRRSHDQATCRPVAAWSPDGFLIVPKFETATDTLTVIIAVVEYGGGLIALAFCYICILIKTAGARRRVQRSEDPPKVATGADGEINIRQKKIAWPACRPKKRSRCHGGSPERVNSSQFRAEASRAISPAINESMYSVCPLAGPSKQGNNSDGRKASSDCEFPTRVKEVKTRQELPKTPSDIQPSGTSPDTSNVMLTAVKSLNAETHPDSTSQPSSSRRSAAIELKSIPDPHPDGVILKPSNLLGIKTSEQSTSFQSATTSTSQRQPRRSLRHPAGRIDIVATVSMTAFIVILFLVIFPYVLTVPIIDNRSECVLTAQSRILIFIIVTASMGLGAVVSPIVLVLFSVDFRRAFWSTCRRAVQHFRHTER